MCEECEEFPVQYVAYFNKAGGKLWRPAQKVAQRPWAIDIVLPQPVEPPARAFKCVEVAAPTTSTASAANEMAAADAATAFGLTSRTA